MLSLHSSEIKKYDNARLLLISAILGTIIFPAHNLNSYCIFGLLFLMLIDGDWRKNLIKGFTNSLFLSFLLIFLIECTGLLYNDNMKAGLKKIETSAGLIALPFLLITGKRFFFLYYKRIMTIYCVLLCMASLICIVFALYGYILTPATDLFFYHTLLSPLKHHAVYFSVFMLIALVFLIDQKNIVFGKKELPGWITAMVIGWMFLFLLLLSSKVMIVSGGALLFTMLILKLKKKNKTYVATLLATLVFTAIIVVFTTNNPVRKRFDDVFSGNAALYRQEKFSTDIYFNGVQFRLLQWRFAGEIIQEKKAFIAGVSPGDAQDYLNQKFHETNIYLGDPLRGDTGFLNFNFHNQFLQAFVESGIIGLLALLLNACWLVILAIRQRNNPALAVILLIFFFFLTESVLERQYGVFIYSFFPLFILNAPSQTGNKVIFHRFS